MKRTLITLIVAVGLMAPTAAIAHDETNTRRAQLSFAPIVQEFAEDGTPMEDPDRVGWSMLLRRPRGLDAIARIRGLEPGGVYTFWWIVVQEDGTFPDDIFVASGAGAIANKRGKATVYMKARTGQPGIEGFAPGGNELEFASLTEPTSALVRIEIAYHGQAEDAGDDLDQWLEDFWTGTECPPETPNPNPAQPHCPVYYAATHS